MHPFDPGSETRIPYPTDVVGLRTQYQGRNVSNKYA